jgi:Lar family restriction alleviation protein
MGKREVMGMEELKPCPFCGKTHIIVDVVERNDRAKCKWTATVFCAHCFGEASNHGFDWTEEEAKQKAINAWNRRVE